MCVVAYAYATAAVIVVVFSTKKEIKEQYISLFIFSLAIKMMAEGGGSLVGFLTLPFCW